LEATALTKLLSPRMPSLAYLLLLFLVAMYYLWRQRRLAEECISLEELRMNETREVRQATQNLGQ